MQGLLEVSRIKFLILGAARSGYSFFIRADKTVPNAAGYVTIVVDKYSPCISVHRHDVAIFRSQIQP